jgi:uncharacterized membrane protein required for colicin V production
MNILDAVIIVLLLVGILGGIRRGVVKEAVLLVGLVLIVVLSWHLRVPVATFLYKHLPFFGFNGLFKDVSILNILLYELIAFLAVFCILAIILSILLKISGIIEKILKATIILGIFSRIGGAIVGFLEGYIIIFIILFIMHQPFINISGIEGSKLSDIILNHTPVLSSTTDKTRKTINEIYNITDKYKNNKNQLNDEMIKIFIKYDIISKENLEYLKEKGKI